MLNDLDIPIKRKGGTHKHPFPKGKLDDRPTRGIPEVLYFDDYKAENTYDLLEILAQQGEQGILLEIVDFFMGRLDLNDDEVNPDAMLFINQILAFHKGDREEAMTEVGEILYSDSTDELGNPVIKVRSPEFASE